MAFDQETQAMFYGYARGTLLQLRQTLRTLPPDADEAERWVQEFTKTLVRQEYFRLLAIY
jgi:hypothetical protein